MKIALPLIFLFLSMTLVSCKKDTLPNEVPQVDINSLNASPEFSWATSRDITFNIGVSDTQYGNKAHVISIYTADPKTGGALLSRGSATITSSYSTKISLPTTLTEVWIEKYAPNGTELSRKILANGNHVDISMGDKDIITTTSSAPNRNTIMALPQENSPSCGTGDCSVVITQSSQNSFDMVSGNTYCVTGNNITVKVQNTNGGTMRICGTGVVVEGLKMASNVTVIVSSGASVRFNNLNWEGPSTFKNFGTVTTGNVKVLNNFLNQGTMRVEGDFVTESNGDGTNYGTLTVTGNFNSGARFTNSGTLNAEGNFNSNNNPYFVNTGILKTKQITLAGTFNNSGNWTVASGEVMFNNGPAVNNTGTISASNSKMTASGTFTNSGSVTVQNYVQNSGTLINNCKFITLNLFDNNANIINNSYIQVNSQSNLKGSTILRNGALFKTNVILSLDGTLKGEGSTSLFRVVSTSYDNINNGNAPKITGSIEYADPSGKIQARHFDATAKSTTGEGMFIQATDCNEGNGKPIDPDTDNDGIPNSKDAFPEDPDRAFINQSYNYANGGSTVAFEDNFPLKGDYDMNDIVISYRYQIISNAANQVVHVDANYTLHATGGSYKNGAGIQFDIARSSVSNVTGAEIEEQPVSKDLVLILFRDSREQQARWNTIPNESTSDPVKYNVSFDVKPGITVEAFGIGNYNPFIWNATVGFGRGYETHLKNRKPTDFADTKLFRTGDDGTVGGGKVGSGYVSYISKDQNLPWAIELPVSNFKYPIEKTTVTSAYLSFGKWALSLGKTNMDWYTDGNVDNSKVFSVK
ncbi:LruC domain-containing protein [Pedobacter ginsengisoli]|uniref:LruC domain-containing protein n=1 Tax=Pedobacter ginsengisoli TaxID=363852 RepID=UPI00254DC40B|nr:LruC domain-containing protein [Pedobacter ginsengisoli]